MPSPSMRVTMRVFPRNAMRVGKTLCISRSVSCSCSCCPSWLIPTAINLRRTATMMMSPSSVADAPFAQHRNPVTCDVVLRCADILVLHALISSHQFTGNREKEAVVTSSFDAVTLKDLVQLYIKLRADAEKARKKKDPSKAPLKQEITNPIGRACNTHNAETLFFSFLVVCD